jgi:hypothetical protein
MDDTVGRGNTLSAGGADQFGHAEDSIFAHKLLEGLPVGVLLDVGVRVVPEQPNEHFPNDAPTHRSEAYLSLIVYKRMLRFRQDVVPERRIIGEISGDAGQEQVVGGVCLGRLADTKLAVRNRLHAHGARHPLPGRQAHCQAPHKVARGKRRESCRDRRGKVAERIYERSIDLIGRLEPFRTEWVVRPEPTEE